jgi:multiple sugar transport system ATP-binding protein
MQRRLGTTMIYVTHDQLEAMSMADSIAVMHQGVLQQLGTPQEIYNNPVNEWVAGFVGEPPMNFVDAEVVEGDGRMWLQHPGFKVPCAPEQETILRQRLQQRQVRMGIRPDQIRIANETFPDGLAARIRVSEPLGGDMLVDTELAGSRMLVKTNADFRAEMDTDCWLAFDTSRWHVFERPSGVAYF